MTEKALREGNKSKVHALFDESVACYHTGQHVYFIDSNQNEKAIILYHEKEKSIRIEIPFNDVKISGYF
ncbi:hypothetical protein A0J52_15030 [Clostridium sporogenes]|uniref:hypothetical protein n=1 Tax=Clostridium TaxID=1485 RepID=UPI000696A303|nr:hypothetical protein [Clostridium sporogenes]KYN76299.1 hypothetical protein A0J52_15030 [Clostridium sporogenes]MBW5458042.1 hypothetical protein [Clostridium sporogenes]MDS1005631.1 hypothetical protein [Clostridium sporogenes]NFQ02114.1 hypothetical protein [Clostridium sporogenes]NFQ40488.1 hypothetical protein [Clostridium sporogenes]